MSAIDKVKKHFDTVGYRKMHIEEWDLTVYSTPLTMAEHESLTAKAKKKESDSQLLVYAIILKALDAKGENLFSVEDKNALMKNADSSIINNLGGWILASTDEKKS